ncbi:MAG TPA: hypothetical protein VIT45_15665 [Allosphingosinicella sp.]
MKSIHAALLAGASLILMPAAAMAQEAPAAAPAAVEQAQPVEAVAAVAPAPVMAVLPANTEIPLSLNETISSKTHRLGDKVALTVAQDVKVDGVVLIPQGTRAVGQVTRRSNRGSFGKSGKMDVTFRYIDLDGTQIPVEGRHHQEGSGNTAAAIGAMVAAGVVGGLMVKGKSAKVEQGREFTIHTAEAIPAMLPADGGTRATLSADYRPAAVDMQIETPKQRKAREKAEKAARNQS